MSTPRFNAGIICTLFQCVTFGEGNRLRDVKNLYILECPDLFTRKARVQNFEKRKSWKVWKKRPGALFSGARQAPAALSGMFECRVAHQEQLRQANA
jgi:hypothetical protein